MNYYQEITIIKSPEVSPYFIWSKLFMQVHLAMVENKGVDDKVNVGVSFPEYHCFEKSDKTIMILGTKLRVFAHDIESLEKLALHEKLSRLLDYVHIKSISEVKASQVKYHVTVKRAKQHGNIEKLTRRFAKRKGISFEEAKQLQLERYAKEKSISLEESLAHYENPSLESYPYIIMDSLSSDKKFSLEIIQTETEQSESGVFNTYGMSGKTTVPHW